MDLFGEPARNHRRRARPERGCKIFFIFGEDDIARTGRGNTRHSNNFRPDVANYSRIDLSRKLFELHGLCCIRLQRERKARALFSSCDLVSFVVNALCSRLLMILCLNCPS
jgi:hypothetical protein